VILGKELRVGRIKKKSEKFPATWEVEIGKILFEANLDKMLEKPHINQQAEHVVVHL
jgi:hypothetical protein